jgi:hypothetical protein
VQFVRSALFSYPFVQGTQLPLVPAEANGHISHPVSAAFGSSPSPHGVHTPLPLWWVSWQTHSVCSAFGVSPSPHGAQKPPWPAWPAPHPTQKASVSLYCVVPSAHVTHVSFTWASS